MVFIWFWRFLGSGASKSGWGRGSGESIGEVTDVINLPGQDLLAIKTQTGEILIPFVRQLVPVVDVAARKVIVIPPEMTGEVK